jgi:hypothetical protein
VTPQKKKKKRVPATLIFNFNYFFEFWDKLINLKKIDFEETQK